MKLNRMGLDITLGVKNPRRQKVSLVKLEVLSELDVIARPKVPKNGMMKKIQEMKMNQHVRSAKKGFKQRKHSIFMSKDSMKNSVLSTVTTAKRILAQVVNLKNMSKVSMKNSVLSTVSTAIRVLVKAAISEDMFRVYMKNFMLSPAITVKRNLPRVAT